MTEHRDNQCPARGYGLSHVQDSRARPDGSCTYCDRIVAGGPRPSGPPTPQVRKVEPTKPSPPREPEESAIREAELLGSLTERQRRRLEFLQMLARDHPDMV